MLVAAIFQADLPNIVLLVFKSRLFDRLIFELASRTKALAVAAVIVNEVLSVSIFSPPSPNLNPTFTGMLISVAAVKFKSTPAASV